MDQRRYKVRLNSSEKLEELLQEVYDQACRQINEIQNEINKLTSSTNLGAEDFTMEDKAKYSKAIHDYLGDKNKAIASKLEIAKFLGEVIKYNGSAKDAVNDKNFQKRTSLNLDDIRAAIKDDDGDTNTYNLKKN
jgi:predicted house-cleaning noncanonical NTP pyrophosphatase (MazG superfamily)